MWSWSVCKNCFSVIMV